MTCYIFSHRSSLILIFIISYAGLHSIFGQCDRTAFVDEYQTFYLGSEVTTSELGWSGDELACTSGNISLLARDKTLIRINYFRRLAKVSTEISFDETLTPMCQDAALMMHRNNELSHDPPPAWSCYSEEGKQAASKSNLALGAHSTRAISLYMLDPGENNGPVGHRRWILYSRADKFGMGSTSRAHSLYVIHNKVMEPDDLDYIAYPADGFFPAPLLPDRWSIGVPGANFEEAEVEIINEEGENISVEILPYKGGFGDNTLVWEPDRKQVEKFNPIDQKYEITVSNVLIKEVSQTIKYTVIVAQPVHPPSCLEGQEWNESMCGCEASKTTIVLTTEKILPQLIVFPSPADIYLKVETSLDSQGTGILKIFNVAGEIMLRKEVGVEVELNIGSLPTGIYLVTVQSSQGVLTSKVAVVH